MLEEGYSKVGKNLVQVWAGRIGEDFTPAADRRHLWFTRKHVDLLRRKSRYADLVAGEVSRIFLVSFGQKTQTTNVRGVVYQIDALMMNRSISVRSKGVAHCCSSTWRIQPDRQRSRACRAAQGRLPL